MCTDKKEVKYSQLGKILHFCFNQVTPILYIFKFLQPFQLTLSHREYNLCFKLFQMPAVSVKYNV